MRHFRISALALLAILCLNLPLSAQTQTYIEDKWEFSLFFGYDSVKDKSSATAAVGLDTLRLVTLDFESGYIAGFRITENLGRRFGAELEYSLANQPLALKEVRPGLARFDAGQRIHSVNYSVLYYPLPPNSRWRPYAAAGLGVAFFQLEGDDKARAEVEGLPLKDRWKLAGTLGGGVKYRVNNRFGVRFDIRDQLTGVPSYGLPKASPSFQGNVGAGFNDEGLLTNLQISAGILFYWGGF